MAGHAVAFWSSGSGSGVEVWAHVFHRYFLPVAGVASVVLAVGWFLGVPAAFDLYAPSVLLVAGAGMLTLVLTVLWSSRPPGYVRSATPRPHVAEAPFVRSRLSDRRIAPASDRVISRPPAVSATLTPPPMTRSSASAAESIDAMWDGWASEIGSLPVELVGPVAETAWVPPLDGAILPFPFLDPEPTMILDPSFELMPEAPLQPPNPFPGESEIPVPFAPPMIEPARTAPRSIPLTEVEREALMPLPPHLRAAPVVEVELELAAEAPAPLVDGSIVFCATCAVNIEPGTRRSTCNGCGELVCGQCEFDALMTHGREWCADCAPTPGIDSYLQTGYLPGA